MNRAHATLVAIAVVVFAACSQPDDGVVSMPADQPGARKDLPPVALNPESPIDYPRQLFEQGIEGSVLLRLYVDSTGVMVPDSSRVFETSGYPALDSAALAGAADLRYSPALRDGEPVAATFLQPVEFRAPGEIEP